ncbi:MAG: hypothetical protein H6721_01605 [Sandaracinus sp.]|nr:hypothetical protein [Sandaracinus sp.]MCB9630838.1 hypothetical protein [Sandaracinus sp.]
MLRFVPLLLLALGCETLGAWSTDDDEIYRGVVVGNDEPDCATGSCSFIRRGFAPRTTLELDLDPENASTPGTLTTVDERCGPTFTNEPLRPIATLAHDALSQYDFPGGQRARNFIYAMEPTTGPLAGRDAMVFVSLMRDGDVEVRIVAGDGADDCSPDDCAAFATGRCDFFGVFRMKLRDR